MGYQLNLNRFKKILCIYVFTDEEDIDALLNNTKFFFNVVDEYIVCKYRYKEN